MSTVSLQRVTAKTATATRTWLLLRAVAYQMECAIMEVRVGLRSKYRASLWRKSETAVWRGVVRMQRRALYGISPGDRGRLLVLLREAMVEQRAAIEKYYPRQEPVPCEP